ncbi:hypothetical protein BJ508DRAFT_357593 [Ascobolus immersus RN42]|uniref:RNase MRP protein 1 RNA binding domain-containing protein n=1 Tax=Ascobolus immersus RN42 TaxID=1160509 RepID=A0A3N4ILY9_ASCIM|nr:hypothetical protein BJ508DRAFT_357593 [Ascobolus immersus RN42]
MPKTNTKRSLTSDSLPIRKRTRTDPPSNSAPKSSEKKKTSKSGAVTSITDSEGPTKGSVASQNQQLSKSAFVLSKSAHTILTTDLDVINKLNYRNKNQHRVSKWWKWFDLLRRHLRKLLAAYAAKDFKVAEERAEYLKNWIVPGAYVSFSRGLVAAKSWAGLGILLLGLLARIHGALASNEEIQELIAETARLTRPANLETETLQNAMDDIGETLERNMEDIDEEIDMDDFTMHEDPIMDETSATPEGAAPYKDSPLYTGTTETVEPVTREIEMANAAPDEPISKPKKKKSKKGDAGDDDGLKKKKKKKKGKLDDLFAGLI